MYLTRHSACIFGDPRPYVTIVTVASLMGVSSTRITIPSSSILTVSGSAQNTLLFSHLNILDDLPVGYVKYSRLLGGLRVELVANHQSSIDDYHCNSDTHRNQNVFHLPYHHNRDTQRLLLLHYIIINFISILFYDSCTN